MHSVKEVKYISDYKLALTFEDEGVRILDLASHLDGEISEPLKGIRYFKSVRVNPDLDTIVWENGADMAPEFLHEIGIPLKESRAALLST